MKNKNYYMQRIKDFCILSGVYYRRLQRGMTVSQLVSQLDTEEYIYNCYKSLNEGNLNEHVNVEDLFAYTGFLEKDEDIEANWYALSKAIYDYSHNVSTGNKTVDE